MISPNSESISSPSTSRERYFLLGHILYFSSLAILNNPIVYIETQFRFALFFLTLMLGTFLILFFGKNERNSAKFRYLLLVFLLVVATIRINTFESNDQISSTTQIVQSILSIISIFSSVLISNKFDIKLTRNILFITSLISFVPIFMNRYDIFDFFQKDTFKIGTLTFDSYQNISQIIGMMVICALSYLLDNIKNRIIVFIMIFVISIGLYTITLSPARGEFVALLIAMMTYFVSGGRWALMVIMSVGLIVLLNTMLDSVLFTRLADVLYGDFSERDYLFSLAVDQIIGNTFTFSLGGGINYFQIFNYLNFDLYPHNFLLEGFISGGILLFIALVSSYFVPLFGAMRRSRGDSSMQFLICGMIYLLVIYSKSGTLNSFWGLGIYTCFFAAAASAPARNAMKRVKLRTQREVSLL